MANDEDQGISIGGMRLPDYLKPTYANYANVSHTPWDFRVTFGVVQAPLPGPQQDSLRPGDKVYAEAVVDIMIPANLMHGLIAALQQNFETYLDSYGPPGFEPEGPGRRE